MPTYEYECLSCKHQFEVSQSMTAQPLNKCPKCGKKLKRLIGSGAGFIFKGPGFYANDYKKTPAPKKDAGACHGCPSAKSCPTNNK